MNKYLFVVAIMLFGCNEIILAEIKQDTLSIIFGTDTILKYDKAELNEIIDSHPEFNNFPQNPYTLYSCIQNHTYFGGEAGQDYYFLMYAHFLKQRNGIQEYEQQRKNLLEIYQCINSLYQLIKSGGTYFGHQVYRMVGYAEYSVYLYKINEYELTNSYDIMKQKSLYIKSLRQIIEDEFIIDTNDKKERLKKMNEIVNRLDSLITNTFYLRRAQEFQYSHYEYY